MEYKGELLDAKKYYKYALKLDSNNSTIIAKLLNVASKLSDFNTVKIYLSKINSLGINDNQSINPYLLSHLDDDPNNHYIRAKNFYNSFFRRPVVGFNYINKTTMSVVRIKQKKNTKSVNDWRDPLYLNNLLTDQEKMALKFSDLMDKTPNAINEEFYEELAEHFSIPEIVELGAFIGFNIGFHRFFGTLQFYPMFSPEGELVDQEKSKEAYGDKPVSHRSFGNAQ